MTYLQAMEPGFRQAAQVIWNSTGLDARTSYSAHRIKSALDKVLKEAGKMQIELGLKHAKKTKLPDGKEILHRDPNGNLMFEGPEQQEAFGKEFEEVFTQKTIKLEVSKLQLESLGKVQGLAPALWEYLEPILEAPQTEVVDA